MTKFSPIYNNLMKNTILNDFLLDNVNLSRLRNCYHAVVNKDIGIYKDPSKVLKVNPYHMENDTYTHTFMVYNQIKELNPMMEFLTLYHDIGKPLMRYYNNEKNRVSFFAHDIASAYIAIGKAKKYFNDKEVIDICKHITWHQTLYSELPLEEIFDTNPEYLTDLNYCDDGGRILEVKKQNEYVLPDMTYGKDDVDNSKPTLYIPIGIPGSGKSTLMNEYTKDIISTDDTLMEIACKDHFHLGRSLTYNEAYKKLSNKKVNWVGVAKNKLQYFMKLEKKDVTFDATNLSHKGRKSLYNIAKQNGYNVVNVMVWRNFDDCLKSRSTVDKTITLNVYKEMFKRFTYPRSSTYDRLDHVLI